MVLKSDRIGGGVGVDTVTQYNAPGVVCRGRTFHGITEPTLDGIKELARIVR